MGRSKEEFIKATGGFRIGDPLAGTPLHCMLIQAIEAKLVSGKLSFNEVENVQQELIELKGLPSDEWDYEPND